MSILRPRPESNDDKTYHYYTIVGKQQDFDEDNNPILLNDSTEVLAKKTVSSRKTRYFVKIGPHGNIFNPIGIFSEGRSNKFLKQAGKPEWQFKEVNQRVFNLYLSFLRTKNIGHITLAQREMQ
jgi:hypothetical protein